MFLKGFSHKASQAPSGRGIMMSLLLKITHFFFPVSCVRCGKILPYDDQFRVCAGCLASLKPIEGLYCAKCGKELPDGGEHCYSCRKKQKTHFESIRAACVYEGAVKELVHKFKYGGRDYLVRIMGKMVCDVLESQSYRQEIDYVVPVPMHWLKQYLRGYNQAELLANSVSDALGKPVLKALTRLKGTKPQYKLKKDERRKNLAECFAVTKDAAAKLKGKTLILVDDVCTTCSTIEECSRTLRRAGASRVYAVTFAKD